MDLPLLWVLVSGVFFVFTTYNMVMTILAWRQTRREVKEAWYCACPTDSELDTSVNPGWVSACVACGMKRNES